MEATFIGRGEVRGFEFTLLDRSSSAYLFQVGSGGRVWFECFKRRSGTYGEKYPSSKSFGKWAYTSFSLESAKSKFEEYSKG